MADMPLTEAIEQLELSRERLRLAMRRPVGPARSVPESRSVSVATRWLDKFRHIPLVQALADFVQGWWEYHPMRVAGVIATDRVGTAIRPMAQKNPLAMVLIALVVGGVFAWSRPWRWLIKPALFAGLAPKLLFRLLRRIPPSSWIAVLNAVTRPRNTQPSAVVPLVSSRPPIPPR